MDEFLIAFAVFALLGTASLGTMLLHPRLPPGHRDDNSNAIVRLVANIFVVATSLTFGLLINSAKHTFDTVDSNIHSHATDIILLDRMLRNYGPETGEARSLLRGYAEATLAQPVSADDILHFADDPAAHKLDQLFRSLAAIKPGDPIYVQLLDRILDQYEQVAEMRWVIVEQSEGSLPWPILALLIAWLTLIFMSFGYRSPRNAVVVSSFLAAAILIAASIYIVLDMEEPFSGPIQVSDAPLHRALAELKI